MKICIIGAGPSGVAAATRLIENGFTDLTILEAGPRVGGRVKTVPFGTSVIEEGAQYCHGIRNNAVWTLASKHNYLSEVNADTKPIHLYDSTGALIPADKANKLFELAYQIADDEDQQSYKGSFGNFFMEKYWAALEHEKYNDIDSELRCQFARSFHLSRNAYEGSETWYLTSCRGVFEDEPARGENRIWNTPMGYTTIFDLLQKKIPGDGEPIDITEHTRLNKEVSRITYNRSDSTKPIQVGCTNGSVYEADHVICTVPLGVLKERHFRLFEPNLPQKKINAIETVPFGIVDKIFLEFEQPFWPVDWTRCVPVWKPEQLKSIRENEETRWLEDITGFHTIDNQPNVLLGWISGASARKMEALPDETIIKHSIMLLKLILKDFDIPDAPKRFLRSKWFSNPLFRGSYSSFSVETEAMKATNTHLAEPVMSIDSNRPLIQFAGEATSHNHSSTVHGAIESGWREADRLITFLNKMK